MRIGIDMFGLQSPSRRRGIGRYTRHLVSQFLTDYCEHDWVLFFYEGLPGANDVWPRRPEVHEVPRNAVDRDLFTLPSQLVDAATGIDALLVTCPFEHYDGYMPPSQSPGGPRLAAMLYDVIPALMPEEYLHRPVQSEHYYAALRRVRQYDLLLAISEASRRDGVRWLGAAPADIVVIGAASDGGCFYPAANESPSESECRILDSLGIVRPFFFCLTGADERKNLAGLLAAYACLPKEISSSHRLVITCQFDGDKKAHWLREIAARDLTGSVVLTDYLPDETIRLLYQRCTAFVFPSRYEGFGLPLLEAMHCGAAVVAGRNSSQKEVVGEAGLLVNVDDPTDVAAQLTRLAGDADLARKLRRHAVEQAARFSWPKTAARAMAALEGLPSRRRRLGKLRRLSRPRPRIAFFSPLPPAPTGVATYSHRLLSSLSDHFAIDLFHDTASFPRLGPDSQEFSYFDYRLFPKFHRSVNYRGIVYQMGNSEFHAFTYETLLRIPGLVVLHDLALPDFHYWYSLHAAADQSFLADEIERESPALAQEYRERRADWLAEPGGMVGAISRRGLSLNRRIVQHAAGLVVHSDWSAEQLRALWSSRPGCLDAGETPTPQLAGDTPTLRVIPHGAEVQTITEAERLTIRKRYDLDPTHLLFGCFGILHPSKYHVEVVEAIARLAREVPSARLLFVGQDMSDGAVRAQAIAMGVADRVRFLGHAPIDAFLDLVKVTDIGINLRRPPTHGETSGALLHLLGAGVATVVTDVDAFAGFPDTVVEKVPPLDEPGADLNQTLHRLASQPSLRRQLSEAAMRHVQQVHDWSRVASLYATAIEETHERVSDQASGARRQAISHSRGVAA
jgi:glycosyltransferase involved in cell wall biosynthesis